MNTPNVNPEKKYAIIAGAGPAGLTAAYELLKRTEIIPIILEKSGDIGGISKTINYKGNRIDIGGHRFFSKSDRVMNWWVNIFPLAPDVDKSFTINYQNKSREVTNNSDANIGNSDKVMLVRKRLSRIYFLRRFFTYPITLSIDTLKKLGLIRTFAILFSYLQAQIFPIKPEKSLEDFMINRFGKTLYRLFFKDYTEKVWGIACNKISAEWGAQRIKGVSIRKAIQHALKDISKKSKPSDGDISQKGVETSLIEQFLYPKLGPGQLWEEVADQIVQMGGIIYMNSEVIQIHSEEDKITAFTVVNSQTKEELFLQGDYFFSTMPVKELIAGFSNHVPEDVKEIAQGLQYRDFITVGILLSRLSFLNKETGEWKPLDLKDTWIYIQEKEVTVGRLQIFNNWSPFMVKNPDTVWVGMEFFCNETDRFWKLSDERIREIAIIELEKIGLANSNNVLDSTVLRVEKTYPAYFGTYENFDQVRNFTDQFKNLFLIGRNGMHKYNNSDHSMLTAMVAVDNIIEGIETKDGLWSINTEQEYHEEKSGNDNNSADNIKDSTVKENVSLKEFILSNEENKTYLKISIVAIIIQLLFFKYWYPFASFINGDSYAYLNSAFQNFNIDIYPIGYPKFLRLFSVFSHSDTVLVIFQYLFLQASAIALLFSLCFFFNPQKLTKYILFGFVLFNPVFLYLANYVSSDSLFLSLSLIWFNILLWIHFKPNFKLVVLHGFVLIAAFTIRYNALYYPFIALIPFFYYKNKLLIKFVGFTLTIFLLTCFIIFNRNKYFEITGVHQFSAFSGWQIANNAMYAYRFVPNKDVKVVPAKFIELDKSIRDYFDSTRNSMNHPEEQLVISTIYMWTPTAPLRSYMYRKYNHGKMDDNTFEHWATIAPLYKDYGIYIIKNYPWTFINHFVIPNIIKYYAPPIEFLENYSTGKDSVNMIAQLWFKYKTNKVTTIFKDLKVNILNYYPILVGIVNVLFVLGVISFIALGGLSKNKKLGQVIIFVWSLWIINLGFSVFVSPIALRFQLFLIIVIFCFTVLFLEFIIKETGFQFRNTYDDIRDNKI